MHSCLYEGTVWHRRHRPVIHQFRYQQFLLYLDLAEIPALTRAGIFARDTALATASFCTSDHPFPDSTAKDLEAQVRQFVRSRTTLSAAGPIRLLTQLRYFGYYFSPLNLYYGFRPDSADVLEYVVAEVSNIPWRERHFYVLWSGNQQGDRGGRFAHDKEFHVSPFLAMSQQYRWLLTVPGQQLKVSLQAEVDSQPMLSAVQVLQRTELTRGTLTTAMIRHGWMTAKVVAAIYYEAYRLWRKRVPVYSHPKDAAPCPTT